MGRTVAWAVCLVWLWPTSSWAWLSATSPDVVTALVSQDAQFAFDPPSSQTRWLMNYGGATTSALRGWQDATALKFDLSAYRGRTVETAELHLSKANSSMIFSLAAATMNTDWNEGHSTGDEAATGEPCWRWREYASREWTYPHSDFSTTSFGNFGTLVCYGYASNGTYGSYNSGGKVWVRMKLDPAVVQALILDQYGLVVTDSRNCLQAAPNSAIWTKEGGSAVQPRLLLKFATAVDRVAPGPVAELTPEAGLEDGDVVLRLLAPSDPQASGAFGYTVRYSTVDDFGTATDLERWRIPRPASAGKGQRVLLEGLTPGQSYTFFLQAYDAAGNGSVVRSVTFTLPPAQGTPALPNGPFDRPNPAGKDVRTVSGVLRYWAAAEPAKINPVTGNRMDDGYSSTGADNYKKANAVWDAAANEIRLQACRNEVVGCQVLIEKLGSRLTNVRLAASDLVHASGARIAANPCLELFQVHYVTSGGTYYPDAAIPLSPPFATTFSIPDPARNPAGTNQSVWMDLYVPRTVPAGQYVGTLTIQADELAAPVTVNIGVQVSRIGIPDEPTFFVDLNGYHNPWDYGSNPDLTCLRYFQAAHKHRAMCNALPYKQAGYVMPDQCPTLTGTGATLHADNWNAYDGKYGRFFDGTAFQPDTPASPYTGPGEGVPVPYMYTTVFESWPIWDLDPLLGFDATGQGGAYWNSLIDSNFKTFFQTAPDIYPSFSEGYRQGIRNVVADWFRHAHDKGWTRTKFQMFLNNKYVFKANGDCTSLWLLEECESAEDFRAVGYYHDLFRQGQAQANVPDVPGYFRIDISDRWCQHYGQIDNRVNLHVMHKGAAGWHWPQIKYRDYLLDQDKPETWWYYALGTPITSSGINQARSMIRKWLTGFDGGIPYWQNYQTSWSAANDLSSVYSGQNVPGHGAYDGPIMSIRVKMMRQVQQVIELLNLWSSCPGYNRPRVRDAVSAKYSDHTWDHYLSNLTEEDLYQLRADLIARLESLTDPSGDANGDGHVDVEDLLILVSVWGESAGDALYDPATDFNADGWVDVLDLLILVEGWGS